MKPSRLNLYRWILLILSPLSITIMMYFIENEDAAGLENSDAFLYFMITMIFYVAITLTLFVSFLYRIYTISPGIKRVLLVYLILTLLIYMIIRISGISVNIGAYLVVGFGYSLILTIILVFISFIERVELILLGLIPVIIIGFIINRFGVSEGEFIIPFAFLLSAIGFIVLIFKSLPLLITSKTKGLIFVLLYSVIAILNALLLIKFLGTRPALNDIYDTIGVVIFLLACLALFIILPFSDFTEWPAHQKVSFKRLIITPLIIFLLIFSLKFLLPDKIYRSIFFKEYSQKETIHFQMEDYDVDFSGK